MHPEHPFAASRPARPPIQMSIDKLAPQAVDAEQSVLGSLLIDGDAILRVADFLHPEDFYRQQHADIYASMLALHAQREPIDLVTLADELARRERLDGVGGPAYLATIMNMVPTAVHVEHYGRIVERKAVLRNLIGAAGKIAAVGYEEANDAEVAIDRAESILFEISQRRTVGGFESLATLLGQAYDRLEYLHEHRGQILGIPSGLTQLDTLLGGFQPSDLIILAARPSVGKTSLALNIAQHASSREANRVQEVSEISRGLKQLARELKGPVIAVSQLSRGVEQRGSAEPRLSDLRESGSIEQDADVVIFLYRDGEQNPESEVELLKAKIAKHRNGPIGEVPLQFRKSTTRFHSVVREEAVAPFS